MVQGTSSRPARPISCVLCVARVRQQWSIDHGLTVLTSVGMPLSTTTAALRRLVLPSCLLLLSAQKNIFLHTNTTNNWYETYQYLVYHSVVAHP